MIDRCYIEITNTCNLNCDFCPKHHRQKRQLSLEEFDLITDKVRDKVCFLYFHLMGEPLLHPLLPQFITMAREKGFKTVLTSNGTLLHRCMQLLDTLPHKIQLSLHSHESNEKGNLAENKSKEGSSEKNLSETKLSETNLSEKNLSEKKLSEKNLSEKKLSEKNLSEKNLSEKKLSEKNLSEKNLSGEQENEHLSQYIDEVMQFSTQAAEQGTCVVLRLWNQGGRDQENDEVMRLIERYVPKPWKERPDGFRISENLYLEFDRKFQWPEAEKLNAGESVADAEKLNDEESVADAEKLNAGESVADAEKLNVGESVADAEKLNAEESVADAEKQEGMVSLEKKPQLFCKALLKQIGVLSDGSLVPCCLDHDGDVRLGNLLTQSLEEILSSPRAQALIDGFKHHSASEKLCQNCESALARNSFRGKKRS